MSDLSFAVEGVAGDGVTDDTAAIQAALDDGTHECPAPGCEKRVPFQRFACPTHWYSLPKLLRDALNRAWRKSDFAEHARVRAECVRVLEQA